MGDNKKELVEGAKDIMDEYTNGSDNIQKGLQGAIDKIPLVGGMLNAMVKGPLDEAVSVAKIGLAQSFRCNEKRRRSERTHRCNKSRIQRNGNCTCIGRKSNAWYVG